VRGEALRDTRAERVGDDVEPIYTERRQQVIECISIIAAARRFGPQIVAEQIAWGIPRDQSDTIGEAGELKAPVQRVAMPLPSQPRHLGRDSRVACCS